MQTNPQLPIPKTSPLRFRGTRFLLAALVAGLVAAPLPGQTYDSKKQSPKPLVTSQAVIPTGERFETAKPLFTGKFSHVKVDKIFDHDHPDKVTEVKMNIPWDPTETAKQVTLEIGEPDSQSGIPVRKTYRVLQIHMHRHGEHTMDGGEYQLEMHCVLGERIADQNGNPPPAIAVLGFLIVQGEQNKGLDFYFHYLTSPVGKVDFLAPPLENFQQDLNLLLPHDKTYFSYHGSLTSPNLGKTPLNQTPILWYVLRNEIHVSNDQYNTYFHAVEEHCRIPQPENDSKVWLIIPQPLGEK
jgi:carbonic anhydrase